MLYFLNGWSNEESWEKGPPKSGNSEFKSHFKQSSYLCQCHICALTIFYLWTVNVISPKWLVKWRKLRKGTPQKVGILNSNHILNNHHIYANVIFVHQQYFICQLSILYFLNEWSNEESLEKGPPKSGNSEFKSHFKHSSYLCQCHICTLTIFYLWTVSVIFPKWSVKWIKLRKGTPQKWEFWIQITF